MVAQTSFSDTRVGAAFAAFPHSVAERLLEVREYIFAEARDPAIGAVSEELKWGEPAYLTAETGSGTTVRLASTKGGDPAIFVHCGTTLIADFKDIYGGTFAYEGKRALVIPQSRESDNALRHCIRLALTYHSRKKTRT